MAAVTVFGGAPAARHRLSCKGTRPSSIAGRQSPRPAAIEKASLPRHRCGGRSLASRHYRLLKASEGDATVPAEEEISRMRQVAKGQLEPSSGVKVKAILDLAKQEWGLHGVKFSELMAMVNEAYTELPVEYKSGAGTQDEVVNPPGTNTGSCKIFYLAKINGLNGAETCRMFCEHYQNVLDTPDGNSHANIRAFMKHGWEGIEFAGPALKLRQPGDEEVVESI